MQQADTQAALDELLSLFKDKTAYREHYRIATLFQSEYEAIRQQELSGLLTSGELQVADNRLRNRILQLADALTEPKLLRELRDQYPSNRIFGPAWLAFPLLLLLGGLAYFSGIFSGEAPSFHLSVYFYGDEDRSQLIANGRFRLVYNGRSEQKTSNGEGQVFLSDLPSSLRSETLFIHPDVAGFSRSRLVVPFPAEQNYLHLILPPTEETIQVTGRIFTQGNQPLSEAQVSIDGITAQTGPDGDFSLNLPYSPETERPVRISKAGAILYEAYETIGDLPVRISVNVDQ